MYVRLFKNILKTQNTDVDKNRSGQFKNKTEKHRMTSHAVSQVLCAIQFYQHHLNLLMIYIK